MKNYIIIMVLFFVTYLPMTKFLTPEIKKYVGSDFVISVALCMFAGFTLPNVPIFDTAIVMIFLGTVKSRMDLVCRYILLSSLIPPINWEINIGGHFIGYTDPAGALAIAAYIAARSYPPGPGGRANTAWSSEDFVVLSIYLIFTIGTVGFGNFDDTLRTWINQLRLIVMPYLLFRATLNNTSEYRTVIASFGVISVFLAVYAVVEAKIGTSLFENMGRHLGFVEASKSLLVRGGMMRAAATLGGALELGCFLTMGLFALVCSRDFFKSGLGYYGCVGVTFLGLLATQSRGSLVALFAAAIVLSLALRKRGLAGGIAGTAAVLGGSLKFLASVSPQIAAFVNGGAPKKAGAVYDYRDLLLQRGMQEFWRYPIFGRRLAVVLDSLQDITQGQHIVDLVNVYLVIVLISGLVGFIPFVGFALTSAVRATAGFKRVKDPSLLRMRGFCLAAYLVALIQFSFVSFIDRIPMNFVLVLFGIRILVLERQARVRTPVLPAGGGVSPSPADPVAMPDAGSDPEPPFREGVWVPRLPT